jgi:hypothetical protein
LMQQMSGVGIVGRDVGVEVGIALEDGYYCCCSLGAELCCSNEMGWCCVNPRWAIQEPAASPIGCGDAVMG